MILLINLFEIYNKVDTNEIHRTCVHQLVYKYLIFAIKK